MRFVTNMKCTVCKISTLGFPLLFNKHRVLLTLYTFCTEVMAECLGSHDDFGKLWRASERGHMPSTCIPIIIHEDGVPHFSGI